MPAIPCRNQSFLIVFAVLLAWSSAGAFSFRSGDELYMSGEFSEDMMLAGSTVKFEGTLWGDLLVAARTLTFDGIVDGNINAAAQRITINGEICRSLRVGAEAININSKIDGDVVAFGSEITIASDTYLARDLAVFGSEALIDGEIGSDAYIHGGIITIGGKIHGNLKCYGGKISLAPGAVVMGDFEYESQDKARISPEAQILGETRWKKSTDDRKSGGLAGWVPPPSGWIWSLIFLGGSIILGVIAIVARRDGVQLAAREIRSNGAVAGILGLAIVIFTPLILVLTAVTIVGVPAALAGLTVYGLLFLFGKIIAGIAIGMIILGWWRREGKISLGWSLVIGMILLALLYKIPFFGWFIYLLAWAVGVGAMTLVFFRRRRVPAAAEAAAVDTSG